MSITAKSVDDPFVRLETLASLLSHTRFLFTLRSVARPSDYHSLLLFRLSALKSTDELDTSLSSSGAGAHAIHRGDDQLYVIESTCPHLGAELSHADIEECGADSVVAVCPWHRYDFDLKTGKSETGLRACTYAVHIRSSLRKDGSSEKHVWVEVPGPGQWEVVELRPVSEDFADPPNPKSHDRATALPQLKNLSLADDEFTEPVTLLGWSVVILNTPSPELKVERTRQAVRAFRTGKLRSIGRSLSDPPVPPEVPPREPDLMVVAPGKVLKRGKAGSLKSRIAILHALANIEQWAVDLAWDIIARFGNIKIDGRPLPQQFFSDWTKVAEDEAKHFSLLRRRLEELGSFYGEHSVHAGLWESAQETAHSLSARLCIIHLVHEARGLDVNPTTIAKFRVAGDLESVKVLEIIHHDEITHVTAGHRWFSWVCDAEGVDPVTTFREQVRLHFNGAIKGPFNESDRRKAGMTPQFYKDLHGEGGSGPAIPVQTKIDIGYEHAVNP